MSTPRKEPRNINVPATPYLHKIGFGTGVSVYHMERSPMAGMMRSPWAVKKANIPRAMTDSGSTNYGKMVRREAEILKKLDHPNIVGFRGFVETQEGKEMLVMEECSESLGDLIEKYSAVKLGALEPDLIYTVVLGVASALDYLHCVKKLIHGDIKSYNILIKGDFESVKLCDFGASLEMDSQGRVPAYEYLGTACWMPPEARLSDFCDTSEMGDDCYVTGKADVFALGLTIWEMLALRPPHIDPEESTLETTTETVPDESIISSSESKFGTRPALPDIESEATYKDIIELFNWCTENDPDQRPSAKQILEKLKSIGIE